MRCDRPLSALAHAFSRPSVRAGTTVTRARCGGAPPPPPGKRAGRVGRCRPWAVGLRPKMVSPSLTVGVGRLKKKLFSSTRNEHSRAATPHRPPVSGPVVSGGSGAVHGLSPYFCHVPANFGGAQHTTAAFMCVHRRLARAYHGTCTHWNITSSLMPGAPPP